MKKIMIICAVLGFAWSGAEAQSQCTRVNKAKVKKVATTRKVKTTAGNPLQICTEENGYYTCCVYNKSVAKAH
jgi:hypothetical protein